MLASNNKLAACDWIAERRNLLPTGVSGLGKSWLACALGHKACRENISVLYTHPQTLRRSGHRIGMSVAFATPWGTTALCAHRTARVDVNRPLQIAAVDVAVTQ